MKRFLALCLLAALLLGCTQLTAEQIAEEMKKRYESVEDFSGEFKVTTIYNGKQESYEMF